MMDKDMKYLFIIACVINITGGVIYFQPGREYRYSVDGTTAIDDVNTFKVESKIGILALGQAENGTQSCELKIHYYFIYSEAEDKESLVDTTKMDFTKWCSFRITKHGEVTSVLTDATEHPFVLALKKTILGTLSSKLVVSESHNEKQLRWAYKADEIGHEGAHESTYQAEPNGDIIKFTKQKHTPPMKGATHKFNKNINLNVKRGVLEMAEVEEAFATPTKPVPGPSVRGTEEELKKGNLAMAMPAMGGNSKIKLVLDKVLKGSSTNKMPVRLKESSLEIGNIPDDDLQLTVAQPWILGNLSIAAEAKFKKDNKKAMPFFRNVTKLLKRLVQDDLLQLTEYMRNISKTRPLQWTIYLNALGATASNLSLEVLINETLHLSDASPGLLMNAMVHFVGLKHCPSQYIQGTFEERVFRNPWWFNDTHQTSLVNERAELILGSLVSSAYKCDPMWATAITRELQSLLGTHDPFNHRIARSVLNKSDFKKYVNKKALHILALGNGRMDSSLEYYQSFLNTSESHLHLRCSAVEAIRKYQHVQAAEMLLAVVITDEDETVRNNALVAYEKHPLGGDLSALFHKSTNNTTEQHHIMKRSLASVANQIWKGFEFDLELPGLNWQLAIGGSMLGASMGIIMLNSMAIKISPLSGYGKVTVEDKAWATVHVGIFGFDLDIFRAELCYKGEIGYDLNILAEFGFDDLKEYAEKFGNIIQKVVNTIKNAIEGFKSLINMWDDFDIGELFDRFIAAIKDMPKTVLNLKKIGRKVFRILADYVDLPPIVEMIRDLVEYVNTLFSDIKEDIMTFYNSIVDTISTTLPWAWDELIESFHGIVEAFKKIVRNPQQSMQTIARGIARITAAVGVVLEAKNKIQEANIFDKEQRPYWFDLTAVIDNIFSQIQDITNAIGGIQDSITFDDSENSEALEFTGVDLKTMTLNMLKEIWQKIQAEFQSGPLEVVREILLPFLETYDFFMKTVTNIKEAWTLIVDGYRTAKTTLQLIFGFKFDKSFPRKYLESATCGEGFWESNGNNHYEHPGVDIDPNSTNTVVSPANGFIWKSGTNQVSILVEDIDEVMVIIENIALKDGLNGTEVSGGSVIGTLTQPYWCSDKHIHLSMKKTTGNEYIDPSKYLEKRKMPRPGWIEHCDTYIMIWKMEVVSQGSVTHDPEEDDQTPAVSNAPSASELEVAQIPSSPRSAGKRRKRRFLNDFIDNNLGGFAESLGLPSLDTIKDVFSLNMKNITMANLLNFLDQYSLTELKAKIESYMKKIQEFGDINTCQTPASLTLEELKRSLVIAGKSSDGNRKTLENRYLESDDECYGIRNTLGKESVCHFSQNCLSVSCCINLKFYKMQKSLSGFITLDPCSQEITFGIESWKITLPIGDDAIENNLVISASTQLLDIAQLMVYYKVEKDGNNIKVSFGVTFCSTYSDKCMDMFMIAEDAQFIQAECNDENAVSSRKKRQLDELEELFEMTVGDFLTHIEILGLDEEEMSELMVSITDAFQEWLLLQIQTAIANIFGDEFESFDICMKGKDLWFGPYEIEIYTSPPLIIALGPIPCMFMWGISGFYGATYKYDLCLVSMKATGQVTPILGSLVWGQLGIDIDVGWIRFTAVVKLIGYLMTTSFPTKFEVEFSKFPLDVKGRMDMVLIPLRIELRVILKLTVRIKIWGKTLSKTWTVIDMLLWAYQTPSIKANIFNINDLEPDDSPPSFEIFTKDPVSARKKRSGITAECTVYQIPGKDYTEPEFFLATSVVDDRSEVKSTYCVGKFPGGCDIIKDESFGGDSIIQRRSLYPGIPLHFTITAANSAGGSAKTTCVLPTFDVTPPGGRITADFKTTSHPHILRAVGVTADDTPIVNRAVSVGYGIGEYGGQIVEWQSFAAEADARGSEQVINDAAVIHLLDHFANPRQGRLGYSPFYTTMYAFAQGCAKDCLAFPGTKCMSFNYDYGPAGTCELLQMIEGEFSLHHSGSFYHFERYGITQTQSFNFDVNMEHNTLVFFNMHLKNKLVFERFQHASGILVDLTPPHPGPISNASIDITSHEDCSSYTPSHLSQRCMEPTPVDNYRFIIDGPGSSTVFNGHGRLVDLLYTRANTFASANWDGFGDHETSLLIYSWAIGTEPCGFNIHPHKDPHAHIAFASEWTHIGLAHPLTLEDGQYHITVLVLNDVEFGGPMALTVCHTTPYIVDTTDPVIVKVYQAQYNESHFITMDVEAYDALSGLKRGEVSLGYTKRDTYEMVWTEVEDYINITFQRQLPDGKPIWVKIRVTDNVDLRDSDNSPRPILIDESPPIAGQIYHGSRNGEHMQYQSNTTTLCVNWDGFYDPDSGLTLHVISAGTQPMLDDIAEAIELPADAHDYCIGGLNLHHNTMYYVNILVENGATLAKNATASSPGVLVDTTAPETDQAFVYDGMTYSSSSTTVKASWGNFTDPESGLKKTDVTFYRTATGTDTMVEVHSNLNLAPNVSSLEQHHFHFRQEDTVHFQVTETNQASLSAHVMSDGYLVDLTEPELFTLFDGYMASSDRQYISEDRLSGTWYYEDHESGIDHFELTAFSVRGGRKEKVLPTSEDNYVELPASTTTYRSDPLDLNPGGFYFLRIAAINKAGLTAIHDTDGVVVDFSPPEMDKVNAGVVSGSERVIEGFVFINDRSKIIGSWKGFDLESGITEYFVGVGSEPGNDDVLPYSSLGLNDNGQLTGMSLSLTSADTGLPVYYINVYVSNGAGTNSSVMSSSPIKVVEKDKEGVIWDGPGESYQDDIDIQLDRSTVTIGFSGFESALHGIAYYEWAIGTQSRFDDIMPYTDEGIIVEDGNSLGMGSDGIAQMPISLDPGIKYYSTIRAITGSGNLLDSVSDGILGHITEPSIEITKYGLTETADLEHTIYQTSSDIVEFTAIANDTEGLIVNSVITVSNFPAAQYHNLQLSDQGEPELMMTKEFHPNDNGIPNYVTVTVQNSVGLTKTVHSSPLVVDDSAPLEGSLICPDIISGGMITCEWDKFIDSESGIAKYLIGFGVSEGDTSIVNFLEIDNDQNSITLRPEDGLNSVIHNKKYFMTIKAINNVNLETTVYSSSIQVDSTPPTTGWIIELKDYTLWDSASGPEPVVAFNQEMDAICQRDLTQIRTAWQPFGDEESQIAYYEIGIGSTPGGTQIQSFLQVESDVEDYLFRNLDLYNVREVFVILKGFNNAGLYSTVISNGVFISKHSAGFPPLRELLVSDGPYSFDIDHQNNRDTISASWDFYGDPCPVVNYQWGVERFDGQVILNMTDVPAGQTYANADELQLYDKEFYFVKLKAINVIGYVTILHSDGVEVKVEPLLPGTVRDGLLPGIDIALMTDNSSCSANWNGFGQERTDGTFGDVNDDIADSQAILYYEVAVGTDRRYPDKRNNVHHYLNVGLNKTWTFNNLDLSDDGSTYYVTVRAYSVSTAVAEVTSNGVQIRDVSEAALVEVGKVNIPRYIASESSLVFDWSSFVFLSPVIRNYWGIKNGTDVLPGTTCYDLISNTDEVQNLLDVSKLAAVGLDTYISKQLEVPLDQGESYRVYVIAVDEFGLCGMTSEKFTVDVTPPIEGVVTVGVETEGDLMFTSDADTLTAHWSEYKDEESGLKQFKIKLMTSDNCGSRTVEEMTQLSEDITIDGNYVNYTFLGVDIERNIPYFVKLETENNAGLIITTLSRPILADFTDPIAGKVVDGLDFKHDVAFQSLDTDVAGTLLYTPPGNSEPCPFTTFDSYKLETDLTKIVHRGMWTLPDSQNDDIEFRASQVKYTEENQIKLKLRKDIKSGKMFAGAVMVDSDVENSASYEFDIKYASKLDAVTSVTLWDGPQGLYVGHHVVSTSTTTVATSTDSGDAILQGILDPLKGDTFPSEYSSARENGNGFGFHISSDESGTLIVLWAYNQKKTRYVDKIFKNKHLNKNKWHTYKLLINDEDEDLKMDNWMIKLLINGKLMGEVAGVTGVMPDSKLIIGIHREDSEESIAITNNFQPPMTQSMIKIKRFPPSSTELCRRGLPFQATDHDILEFQVGIGSEKDLNDIIDFQRVYSPCIPCRTGCHTLLCNHTCKFDQVQVIDFRLENIQLPDKEIALEIANSSALLKQYYITVKGVTGSGRQALASSNGFYIDKTPPSIHRIHHLDPGWSSTAPIEHQGNNSTISIIFEADDDECEIIDFQWGIGTSPGSFEVQPLISVGTKLIASNDTLTLEDNTTYFVTIFATNEAGLTTLNFSSGVTVVLTPPIFDDEAAGAVGTEPIGGTTRRKSISSPVVNTVKYYLQNALTCQWTVTSDQYIDSIFGGIGTNGSNNDILSEIQVAWNTSGRFTINPSGLSLDGGNETTVANLSSVANAAEPNDNVQTGFLLERGRSMVCNLRACNKGHVCSSMPTKNIIIVAEDDIIQPPDDDGLIHIQTMSLEYGYQVNLDTEMVQNSDTYIVVGILSPTDLEEEYISAASTHFTSFIADPATTYSNTERLLYQRIISYKNISFYVTPLPEQAVIGAIELVVTFPGSQNGSEDLKLLTWCHERDLWIDAACTCDNYQSVVSWTDNTIKVRVCSIDDYCASLPVDNTEESRKRRAAENENGLETARSIILASVESDIVNYPPYLVSDTEYQMYEDAGTVEITLSAVDPEGDQFEFILNTTVYVSNGTVNLSQDGLLTYKPCQDCFGTDNIHFDIIERHVDDIASLSTSIILTIEILALNDNPEIVVINEGRVLPVTDSTITLIVDNNSPSQEPYAGLLILLSSFDVDGDGLSLYYEAPEHGVFEIKTQRQTTDDIDINCDLVWIDMYDIWEEELSKFESHQPYSMPIPCDLDRNLTVNEINWMLASMLYTPISDYIGPDSIKVYAADEHGTPSELITINIYVLEDLCWNNATCYKPVTDETCTSTNRSSGFDGYYCICAPGFTGVYCETDIDECASQPCDKDYVCVDEIANFTCVCEEGKDCLHTGLYDWQIILIVLAIVALAIIAGVIMVCCLCCKNKKIGCMNQPKDKYQPDSSPPSRSRTAKSTSVDINASQWVTPSPRAPRSTNYEDFLRQRQPKLVINDNKLSVDQEHLKNSFDNESTPIASSVGSSISVNSSHINEGESTQKRKFNLASSPEPPTADDIDDIEEMDDANKAVFHPKWTQVLPVSSDGHGKQHKVKKNNKRGEIKSDIKLKEEAEKVAYESKLKELSGIYKHKERGSIK